MSDLGTTALGDGLVTTPMGLGCMGMSQSYGVRNDEESTATIHRALDLGLTFLDTADTYGPFINEELVGRAIKGRRDEVTLATKFGIGRNDAGAMVITGTPEYVRACCDASLQRLGVDHFDLYYQHRVDPNVPIAETWGAMKELVDEGKALHLGISEASVSEVREAHAVHPIAAAQFEYSLFSRDVEAEHLPLFRELGIGLVAYSPIGRGFLSGEITSPADFAPDDFRATHPRFMGENFDRNLAIVREVQRIAESKGVNATQLAIAWVLAQGDDIVPIPGTKRRTYLEQNIGALDVKLTADDLAAIAAVAPIDDIAGDRYSLDSPTRPAWYSPAS
jgi:aryl-alcohol dehydrogenase-like predicted oxidoreductase